MNLQFNTVLEKGKPGVIRGRKANGSAGADGRVADTRKWFFCKTHLRQQRRVFLCPESRQPYHKQNIQVGGGP